MAAFLLGLLPLVPIGDKGISTSMMLFIRAVCHFFCKNCRIKNQPAQQQNQAKHSVSLFFEMHTASEQLLIKDKNVSITSQQSVNHINVASSHSKHHSGHSSVVQNAVRQNSSNQSRSNSLAINHPSEDTGASWVFVFDQLVSEIKIRHYSPKTLKAYRGYIHQFQTYTKSKDPACLGEDPHVFATVNKVTR